MGSEAVEVMGVGDNLDHRGIPTIDNGKCLVRCANGAMASIDLIFSMHHPFPPARMAYVVGDEGALAIDGNVVTVHTSEGVEQKRCLPGMGMHGSWEIGSIIVGRGRWR